MRVQFYGKNEGLCSSDKGVSGRMCELNFLELRWGSFSRWMTLGTKQSLAGSEHIISLGKRE